MATIPLSLKPIDIPTNPMIHVLVVDDEADIQMLFQQKFRREIKTQKIDFRFAQSAPAALKYLESAATSTEATLILSDINMPGMNGLELLRVIKEKYPELMVLMVTAYGDDQSEETARKYGASGFVNKPVDFAQLKKNIFDVASNNHYV